MASLKSIRKRIVSVKNTQKITKAMKMVAAAKLRRAQAKLNAAKPYAEKLQEVASEILKSSSDIVHPLTQAHPTHHRVELLVFTSDRGLCGGFNSNLLRRLDLFLFENREHYKSVNLAVVGRKGRDYFKARKREVQKLYTGIADTFDFNEATKLAGEAISGFLAGEYDEFYIAFNHFKSMISQEAKIEKILPMQAPAGTAAPSYGFGFIYEPSPMAVLDEVFPLLVATKIYRAFLESQASELGARMSAMDNATNNASDMIGSLTLKLNRARQAAITTELMDIVNGAESLKG